MLAGLSVPLGTTLRTLAENDRLPGFNIKQLRMFTNFNADVTAHVLLALACRCCIFSPFQTSAAAGRAAPASWCPPPWQRHRPSSSRPPALLFTSSTRLPLLFSSLLYLLSPFFSLLSWFLEVFLNSTRCAVAPRVHRRSPPVVHYLLSSFTHRSVSFWPPLASSFLRCSFSPPLVFASFFWFALFQNFSTPLTLHPLCCRLSPQPSPSSASRIDGLSAKFTSSVSLCSTRDTERWSRQFCFLSLLCVATCIAELAGVDVSRCGSSPPPCRTLK